MLERWWIFKKILFRDKGCFDGVLSWQISMCFPGSVQRGSEVEPPSVNLSVSANLSGSARESGSGSNWKVSTCLAREPMSLSF